MKVMGHLPSAMWQHRWCTLQRAIGRLCIYLYDKKEPDNTIFPAHFYCGKKSNEKFIKSLFLWKDIECRERHLAEEAVQAYKLQSQEPTNQLTLATTWNATANEHKGDERRQY